MRNRYYNIGISQIPFLTSMALEIYEKYKNNKWLLKTGEVAEDELANYWMNSKLTEKHIVHKGLSRYCDHFITHLGAEHELGVGYDIAVQGQLLKLLACGLKYLFIQI